MVIKWFEGRQVPENVCNAIDKHTDIVMHKGEVESCSPLMNQKMIWTVTVSNICNISSEVNIAQT